MLNGGLRPFTVTRGFLSDDGRTVTVRPIGVMALNGAEARLIADEVQARYNAGRIRRTQADA